MPVASGTKLGPYEVLSLLGAGGMGEVYRARDSRLGRDVAIKALPENLARDPERLVRFEREARLLASLNHPNIAAIYGVEDVGGQRYLVLEYVEGETLASRIARGALSLDETLHVCREIAAGVEAAHEGGVVHRDLKPQNVMLTHAGVSKVLDFGLAKEGAEARSDSAPVLSVSPTMTYGVTQAGMVLGTAAYMSPEQARGRNLDRRTDIWSFGCILFECLCGTPAFEGETVSDLLARILEREPDWSALPARTPVRLRELLKRCMVKDARQRLRDIGDARLELDQLLTLGTSGAIGAAEAREAAAKPRAGLPWWGVAAIVAAAIVATALVQSVVSRRVETMARHFEIGAPEGLIAAPIECVISPDGRMLAMVLVDSSGTASLWVRAMNSFKPRALPGTTGATQPFWSPDNRSLAFFAAGKLKKIALDGGDAETLCDVQASRGGAWNRDGVILFAPGSNGPLFQVSADGGMAAVATRLDSARHETAHRFPRFLPDGRHYLFTVLGGNAGRVAVAAGVLGDASHQNVLVGEGAAAYSPSGHLLFTRNGVLSAQRFDPGSLRLSGEPVSLGEAFLPPVMTGTPVVSVAEDGTLAYLFLPRPGTRIAWFDMGGNEIGQVPIAPGTYSGVALSPDERSALVNRAKSSVETELLVADLERGTTTRISNEPAVENFAWAPDGKRVAYTDGGSGGQRIIVAPADGSAPGETVLPAAGDFRRLDEWTPDGKALIIDRLDSQTQWDIWVLPLDGDRQPRPYLRKPANETRAAVSPDGRWLCYNSDESGRVEGYVQAFPTPGRRYQVTTDGTGVRGWSADGKRLVLAPTPNLTVRTVDILPGVEFRVGPPRVLGKVPGGVVFGRDMDRAWMRTIAIVSAGNQPRPTIRVVLDWDVMIAKR